MLALQEKGLRDQQDWHRDQRDLPTPEKSDIIIKYSITRYNNKIQ